MHETVVEKLIAEGVLKTPRIIAAFKKIHRVDFIPPIIQSRANDDIALPTFENQTISQPYTVAFMLEILQPMPGDFILDVGSGSGWVAAILANIVGKNGKVFAIELVSTLVQFSIDNVRKYRLNNLKIIEGDGSRGLESHAPFDKIHVAAAAKEIPQALKGQMKIGGKMVIPTQNDDIRLITRVEKDAWKEKVYKGFVFVLLVQE